MKSKFWLVLLMLAATATIGIGFASCGDDDDDDNNEVIRDDSGRIVDDDGIPQGTAGNSSMFGYYSDNACWLFTTAEAEECVESGNGHRLTTDLTLYDGPAFRIVDGHTIYCVHEEVVTEKPKSSDYVLVNTKTYSLTSLKKEYSVTLYHIIYNTPGGKFEWEGRYALQGDNIVINTEDEDTYQWTYGDGKIITDLEDYSGYGHESTGRNRTYMKVH